MKKSVDKKGQISIFIIIAVIIIVVIVFVFIFGSGIIGDNSDFDNVETTVLYCVSDIGQEAIETIGIQGGYYENLPEDYIDLEWAIIPYYYNGDLLMPENSVIKKELETYVNDNLGDCIDNYIFEGFEVSYGDIKTSAEIKQDVVAFTVDSKVSVSKDGKTSEINLADNPVDNPSILDDVLEVARFVTDSHKKEMFCMTCLYDMLEDRNLYLDVISLTNSSSLVVISGNSSDGEPYAFEFINKYENEDNLLELS